MNDTAQSEVTRKILDAALEVFGETGFGSARVDEIARRARVNKALLYYYFGSKDALYAAVISSVANEALSTLDGHLDPGLSPEEKVHAFATSIVEVAGRNPTFPPLILREIASGGSGLPDEVLARIARLFGKMAEVLDEGAKKKRFRRVDPVITHMQFVGGLLLVLAASPIRKRIRNLVVPQTPDRAEPSRDELVKMVADLILHGVSLYSDPPSVSRPRKKPRGRKEPKS